MATRDHISKLPVIGGNVSLDFVNTVDGTPGGEFEIDHFRDYGGLVTWSGHVGLLSEESARRLLREAGTRPSEAEATHARALELREVLYGIFAAIARGEHPSERDLETLRREECEVLARASLVPKDEGYGWEWPDEVDLGRVLCPVVHAAVELLTSGPLDRIKTCAGCDWLFVDESKNRSRRWCTMDVCGTHEKVRRYLARRAAGRS
jgi:predicted RNA-binding Zn ribbon-like protein